MPARIPERITWAVAQLVSRRADRVLEVGCGPGHAVTLLCEQLDHCAITAIDRSLLQVRRARARNRLCVRDGKASVHLCTVVDAPKVLGLASFDALLAINVNAFWTAPRTTLSAAAALLKPGGRAYIVYEPPSVSRLHTLEKALPALFADHEFQAEEVRTTTFTKGHGLCVIAHHRP
jgi:SAM-dependent methyltransferase